MARAPVRIWLAEHWAFEPTRVIYSDAMAVAYRTRDDGRWTVHGPYVLESAVLEAVDPA